MTLWLFCQTCHYQTFSISSKAILFVGSSVLNELLFRVSSNYCFLPCLPFLLILLDDLFDPLFPDKLVHDVAYERSEDTPEKNDGPKRQFSVSFNLCIWTFIRGATVELIIADAIRDRALIRVNLLLGAIRMHEDDNECWAGVKLMCGTSVANWCAIAVIIIVVILLLFLLLAARGRAFRFRGGLTLAGRFWALCLHQEWAFSIKCG